MPDISKCMNNSCEWRKNCYRFTSEPSEFWQSYGNFETRENGEGCNYFISNHEYLNYSKDAERTIRKDLE